MHTHTDTLGQMHLYAPMVEAKMRKMVREYPNLEKFVTNFRSKHLGVPTVFAFVSTVFGVSVSV